MIAATLDFGYQVDFGPPAFRVFQSLSYRIRAAPPPFSVPVAFDFVVDAGAIVLMKIDGELVERRMKIKVDGVLVDSAA